MKFKIVSTLIYYDRPQVIELIDTVNSRFIGMLINTYSDRDQYYVIQVTDKMFHQLNANNIDLQTIFTAIKKAECAYIVDVNSDDLNDWFDGQTFNEIIHKSILPNKDFFLN